MPSRKSGSSEADLSSSRRTSLRRLSSIASFSNLFIRRRSHNATDTTTASSSSNLSLSSTLAHAPEPTPASTIPGKDEDILPDLPSLPLASHAAASRRRGSYVCLPDDPIGGMPRSRTFSNLPLPTRAKKATPLVTSKSHSRLPSAFFPSTRLPSPPLSTRRHSHTHLTSVDNKGPTSRNRMKRSDTESLLAANVTQQPSHPARSTAFKENISLSPIKPLPALDMFHHDKDGYASSSPNQYYSSRMWNGSTSSDLPLPEPLSSSLPPLSKYSNHPALQLLARDRESKSSPITQRSRNRPPTPGNAPSLTNFTAPVARWNSQPILTIHPNSQHRAIKQTRLLSTRQAPNPPPPKTPVPLTSNGVSTAGRKKTANNSTPHIRQTSEQTPLHSRSTGSKKPPPHSPPPPHQNVLSVSHPEPPAYWSGRLCALADRYRNEELTLHLSKPLQTPPKSQTDKMHTPEASTARLKRALDELDACCITFEARESLSLFQVQFAAVMKLPELRPVNVAVLGGRRVEGYGDGGEVDGGGDGVLTLGGVPAVAMSDARKMSFMDRLLGRQKRKSLVMV